MSKNNFFWFLYIDKYSIILYGISDFGIRVTRNVFIKHQTVALYLQTKNEKF